MKMQIFLITTLLVCGLHASDSTKQTAAQRYPFSELDKELFYNYETQKMESPYSTASVDVFSKDTLVLIEYDAYNALHTHALKRSEAIMTTVHEIAKKIPEGDLAKLQALQPRVAAVRKSKAEFETMKTTGHHSGKIQLSHRDLVHLLQWSNRITTVWLLMTGSRDDFMLDIKLGDTNFNATPLLKDFIIDTGDHQQEMPSRWLGE